MFLEISDAKYLENYKISLIFNTGESKTVDLSAELNGEVFEPLKDKSHFQSFKIKYNTIEWNNGADFAPEFLLDLSKAQEFNTKKNYKCMKALKNIESKISQLSPALIGELDHYLDYLINKSKVQKPGKLKQDWAGGLRDVQISAIDLQKKALDWRQK